MTAIPVEWVLVVFYGPSAHRATYGRLGGTQYTKDYLQLSRKADFISALANLFATSAAGTLPLTYKWPLGTAPGQLIFQSADRPHLAWETRLGAPTAWRMTTSPSEGTAETIPGDPTHLDFEKAEEELALLGERGAGQPYLLAIKLHGEPRTLHLRAYLADAANDYDWASLQLVPNDIQSLAANTSRRSTLGWLAVSSGGVFPSNAVTAALWKLAESESPTSEMDALDAETGRALADYLKHPAYGLFFDPTRNHDAWLRPTPIPAGLAGSVDILLRQLLDRFRASAEGDAAAESLEISTDEVEAFREQIENNNFEVPDAYATAKTRGSAQKAFSEAVKRNYGYRCAITGNTTTFLEAVAAPARPAL